MRRRCSVCELGESPLLGAAHLAFDGEHLRLPSDEAARPDPGLVERRWEQAQEVRRVP